MRIDINWIIFFDKPYLNPDAYFKLQINSLKCLSLLALLRYTSKLTRANTAITFTYVVQNILTFTTELENSSTCLSGKFSWNIPVSFQEPSSLLRLLKLFDIEE